MAKWDAGRFLNTVGYFEAIPVLSDLQRWLTGESNRQSTTNGERVVGIVLVVGAISEIGGLVIEQLVKSGYRVRAAIADLSLTPFSVPANVQFVQFDLDRDQFSDQVMQGVRSVIICPNGRVPLSPAALANLTKVSSTDFAIGNSLSLFDFTQPSLDLRTTWGAIDDVVMGGVSESGIQLSNGVAVFSGIVSTDNSGGFASVRTRNLEPSLNLSNYQGLELRVKGDGQRYKLFIRTEPKWDGVGYARSFDTIADQWLTIQIPFSELVPIFRAKTVSDAAPIATDQICSLQLMLSKFEYDRDLNPHFSPGAFSLQIESIASFGGKLLPQLVIINSMPISTNLVSSLQTTNLAYSIVQFDRLSAPMVAMIAVQSIAQPEAVRQILGH
jgi:Complex I intermediate-associated protein 30 (CIA30)